MKKFLALLTALALVLSVGAAVFAMGGEIAPSFEAVSVTLFNEVFYGRPKTQTLTFELRDADTGQALDVKTVEYTEAFYEYSPRLDFSVPAYNAGKRFVLALTGGEAELMFENQTGREIGLETYAYPVEADGAPVYVTSFNMTVRPATERFVNITFGGQSLPDTAVYTYPTDALIPAAKLAYADIDVKPLDDGGVMLTAGSKTVLFYPGYNVMINDWKEQPVELTPAVIEGTLFIPARAAAEAFGCGFAYSDDGRTLNLSVGRSIFAKTYMDKTLDNATKGWGFRKSKPRPVFTAKQIAEMEAYGCRYMGDENEKTLYLTFDEGYENGCTAPILDVLREKRVPAAFFVTGQYLRTEDALVRRMLDEGHIVGNHSVNHPSLPRLSAAKIEDELYGVDRILLERYGVRTKYLRPPRGEYSTATLDFTNKMEYTNVFWSVAYKDWETDRQKGKQHALDSVLPQLHNGAVILLHAVSADNAAALGELIDAARAEGYEFKSLDEYKQ